MDDLIVEFVTETSDALSELDQEVVRLEQNPGDRAILDNVFRMMHTIKGTAGFLDLDRLGKVAHAAENLLDLMRDGELEPSQQTVTLILDSLDRITGIVEYLSENGSEPEGDDTELIERLHKMADGGADDSDTSEPAVETEASDGLDADFSGFFAGDDDLQELIDAEAEKGKPAIEKEETPAPVSEPKESEPSPSALPEVAAPPPAKKDKAPAAQSIRVNIDILEKLMEMVSELVLNRNQVLQLVRTHEEIEQVMQSSVQQLSYITTELQEGIMKTRMQPIGSAWSKFPRLIRDLSMDLDKEIELKMFGEETELDRQLLEMVRDPLTHMVRNSCDHGLETPEDRLAAGKPAKGTVTLSAYHEGGYIVVEIADDGRGINIEKVKEKIIANGVATAEELDQKTDRQIMQYIFAAGFSTAETVTSVSGRGVGMDVVRVNIEKIGGAIDLDSQEGKGSTFSIKIPLTLAIVSVLIVESAGLKLAVPQINVMELVTAAPDTEYSIEMIDNSPVLRLRDTLLPLGSLQSILGIDAPVPSLTESELQVVVCRVGDYDFGLLVDLVYDTEEIVVKPVAKKLSKLTLYSGNTILGDGSVIMILDPAGVAKEIGSSQVAQVQEEEDDEEELLEENNMSFLIFKAGDEVNKAIPLELISRLEELEVAKIERVNDGYMTQYRGGLMEITLLGDSAALPEEKLVDVVVFYYDQKNVGLIVDKIVDIVDAPYDIKITTNEEMRLGSTIIKDETTELIDVSALLAKFMKMPPKTVPHNKYELLFVEDSPFFQKLTIPLLQSAGYEVTMAENGRQALDVIEQRSTPFDVIVTDLEMPVMDGIEFAKECRLLADYQEIPLVAYTSSLGGQKMVKIRSAGIDHCILKNDRPELLQKLKDLLEESGEEAISSKGEEAVL